MLVGVAASAACDADPTRAPTDAGPAPELEGAPLMTDADRRRWSLLTVPREGGVARVRALDEPGRVTWEGETRLPAAREIRLLEGPTVLLRAPDGAVHRYEPRSDRLSRVGSVAGAARWSGWDRYGLWIDGDGSSLLEVGPEGTWRYELGARLRWAAPVEEGRVAAVVEEDGETALWLVARGADEPEARARDGFAPPGLVTAWGKRLVLADSAAGRLRVFAVPSLTEVGQVEVGGPVTAMAASPSSHEIYVAVDDPPRLMRVRRFGRQVHEMAELPRRVRELRTAVLGGAVLGHDGSGVFRVPVEGGDTVRVAGDWREDLPLELPDGGILVSREGGPALWTAGGERTLDVAGDRAWAPVRWNPAPPPVVTDRIAGSGDEPEATPAPDSARGDSVPAGEGDTLRTGARDTVPPAPPEAEGEAPEPGFYAVVTAARDTGGVRSLLDRLAGAGYPTAVQTYRDDAGRRWHRGLVGPYQERSGAEAAARQLRRERGMTAWITELRAGVTTEEIFR